MTSDRRYRISSRQLVLLVALLSLCMTPLLLPGIVLPILGRYGWIAGVYSLLGGIIGAGLATAVIRLRPGRPIDAIVLEGLGAVVGNIYLVLLAVLLTTGAGLNLHTFASVASAHDLPLLPQAYPAFLIAGVGTFAAYFGPEVIARSAEVLAPLIVVGLAVIITLAVTNARFAHLLPLWGAPSLAVGDASVVSAFGTARGFLLVLVLGPFTRILPRPAALGAATALSALVIAVSLILPIAVFSEPFAQLLRFPFISAVGSSRWQWIPTQEATVLLLLLWHAIIFVVFAAYVWLGAWVWQRLTHGPWALTVITIGAGGGFFSSLSLPAATVRLGFDIWNDLVVALGIVAPALLLLALRRRDAVTLRAQRA